MKPSLEAITGVVTVEPERAVGELLDWRYNLEGERLYAHRKVRNVVLVLRHDSRWTGRLRWNEFAARAELDGASIIDEEETRAAVWLDAVYQLAVSTAVVSEAMRLVARDNAHHPVRDWLAARVWDGVPRLPGMLTTYWRAESSPLTEAISTRWMIGCVARILQPGCQMDTTLILVGPQGLGKSSSIRVGLVPRPEWFGDARLDYSGRSKDTIQLISGKWIYEIAELVGTRRKENEDVKAFLTRTIDRFRPPYGRNPIDLPRQTVFIGTTNEERFLRDPTGSRRFWPVRVGRVDLTALQRDREQLWAEAAARYARGERWYLSGAGEVALTVSNEEFEESDPWLDLIGAWLSRQPPARRFAVSDVLDGLEVPAERRSRYHDNRVSEILKRLGCRAAGRGSRAMGRPRLWALQPSGGEEPVAAR